MVAMLEQATLEGDADARTEEVAMQAAAHHSSATSSDMESSDDDDSIDMDQLRMLLSGVEAGFFANPTARPGEGAPLAKHRITLTPGYARFSRERGGASGIPEQQRAAWELLSADAKEDFAVREAALIAAEGPDATAAFAAKATAELKRIGQGVPDPYPGMLYDLLFPKH